MVSILLLLLLIAANTLSERPDQQYNISDTTPEIHTDFPPLAEGRGRIQFHKDFLTNPMVTARLLVDIDNVVSNLTLQEALEMLHPELSGSPRNSTELNTCVRDLLDYHRSLREGRTWALQMADATGRPGPGFLKGGLRMYGNYDECLEVHGASSQSPSHAIDGTPCTVYIEVPVSLMEEVGIPYTLLQMTHFPTVEWHVCVPRSCGWQVIARVTDELFLHDVGVSPSLVICRQEVDIKTDISAKVGICIVVFIVLLSCIGTLYDVMTSAKATPPASLESDGHSAPKFRKEAKVDTDSANPFLVSKSMTLYSRTSGAGVPRDLDDSRTSNTQTSSVAGETVYVDTEQILRQRYPRHTGKIQQTLLCFSILKNLDVLLCTKTKASDVSCIHGIRVLSMAWVFLGHTFLLTAEMASNKADLFRDLSSFSMQAVINSELAVDSFFLISGFLLALLFIRERATQGRLTCKMVVYHYVHRYLRLTPLYAMVLTVYVCLGGHLIRGPQGAAVDTESCRSQWWANLLYINNYVTGSAGSHTCMAQTWFLALDMQFHWMAPLAILPLASGWAVIGILVLMALIATHVISTIVLEYTVNGSIILNEVEYLSSIYLMPYCRVGVYAIGMSLGYIIHKKQFRIHRRKVVQTMGWLAATGVGLACTYATSTQWDNGQLVWTRWTRTAHQTVFRLGWALAVSWVVFVCCSGVGGVVNSLLSWKAWRTLSRLTYGAFLLQGVVFYSYMANTRTPLYYSTHDIIWTFLGTWVLSYGLAFIFYILVESPCARFERIFLRTSSKIC